MVKGSRNMYVQNKASILQLASTITTQIILLMIPQNAQKLLPSAIQFFLP